MVSLLFSSIFLSTNRPLSTACKKTCPVYRNQDVGFGWGYFGDREVSIKFQTHCWVLPVRNTRPNTFGLHIRMWDDDSSPEVYDAPDKMTEYHNWVATGTSPHIIMTGRAYDAVFAPDIEPYLEIRHSCNVKGCDHQSRCPDLYLPEWIQDDGSGTVDMGILELDPTSKCYCKFRMSPAFPKIKNFLDFLSLTRGWCTL